MTTDNSGLFSHQQEEEIIPAPCCVGLSGGSGRTYKRGPESELLVKVHPPVWAGLLGGAAGRWCVLTAGVGWAPGRGCRALVCSLCTVPTLCGPPSARLLERAERA